MRATNRWTFLFASLIALGASAVSMPATADAIATPSVRAAPHGQHGFPFRSTTLNLGRIGYVEQEFLISGRAQAYIPASDQGFQFDGRWKAQANPGATAPFTTRLLVRRPVDPDRFNGTVIVEWLNASGADDTQSDWLYMHDEILEQGYAYVGVTTQYIGVLTLEGWETGPGSRYATLVHPGDSYDYSIFAQAGWALTHQRVGDPRPLGNLTNGVGKILATGFSQSAFWLTTYINAIHRLTPVYGGFLLDDGGVDEPLSFPDTGTGDPFPPGVPPTPFIDTPFPFQIRADLNVPTLVIASEFGLSDFGLIAGRSFHLQPDAPRFRVWEFAGATHLETSWFSDLSADINKSTPGFTLDPCDGPQGIPGLIHGQASRAALHALREWANHGEVAAPRSAPRLSLVVPDPADDFDHEVSFNRDPNTHLAVGGIRLPAVAVPTATLNGDRSALDPAASGPGSQCYFIGSFDRWNHDQDAWDGQTGFDPSPTPEPILKSLYPTHRDYLERVVGSALQAVGNGYLRPIDGAKSVLDAGKSAEP
jgi:hypothetical protein